MAIYHCSVKVIGRSSGRSAVASSAYRAGENLYNERDGLTHDYTRKSGIVHTEIMKPEHAPEWASNRQRLWNEVEKAEKRINSQLAREVEVALPAELNKDQQINLVKEYVKENFISMGMVADIAIHDKEDGNPHAHIMLTMRPFENGDFGKKEREWNKNEHIGQWRENWATTANKHLERSGSLERIDHRSYEDQGIDKIAQKHEGHIVRAMERKGEKTEIGDYNREAKEYNRILEELEKQLASLEKSLKTEKSKVEDIFSKVKNDIKKNELNIDDLEQRREEISSIMRKIDNLEYHLSKATGIFKGKERKELQGKIESNNNTLNDLKLKLKADYGVDPDDIDKKIGSLKYEIRKLNSTKEEKQIKKKENNIDITVRRKDSSKNNELTQENKVILSKEELYQAVSRSAWHSNSKNEFVEKMQDLGYKVDWQKDKIAFETSDSQRFYNNDLYLKERFAPDVLEKQFEVNQDKKEFRCTMMSCSYRSKSKEDFTNNMAKLGYSVEWNKENNTVSALSPRGNTFTNNDFIYYRNQYTPKGLEVRFTENIERNQLYAAIAKASFSATSMDEFSRKVSANGFLSHIFREYISYKSETGMWYRDDKKYFPEFLGKNAIEKRIVEKAEIKEDCIKLYTDIARISHNALSLNDFKNQMETLGYKVDVTDKNITYTTVDGNEFSDGDKYFDKDLSKGAIELKIQDNAIDTIKNESWKNFLGALDFLSKENRGSKPLSALPKELEGQALTEWIEKQKSKSRYVTNKQWEMEY